MPTAASHPIQGHVSRGYEAVRLAFAENFARRGEVGGAGCATSTGRGRRSLGRHPQQADDRPWEQDTMVVVHSATKGWPP